MEPTRIYLPETDSDRIAFAMRVLADSTMNMKAAAESESQSNRATIEELRASQATLTRRVQQAERDAYEAKQQLHMMQKNLEDMQGRERSLQAQVNKWKNMSQAFQRMFSENTDEQNDSNAYLSSQNNSFDMNPQPQQPQFSFAAQPTNFQVENNIPNIPTFGVKQSFGGDNTPDLRTFFATARVKLSPVELRALMDHFKQSRQFGKPEFVDRARGILAQNQNCEDLMSQIPALYDRNN